MPPRRAWTRPPPCPIGLAAAIAPARSYAGDRVSADLMVRGVMAWTHLFGAVSFELFGQRHRVVSDDGLDVFFAEEVERLATQMGLR